VIRVCITVSGIGHSADDTTNDKQNQVLIPQVAPQQTAYQTSAAQPMVQPQPQQQQQLAAQIVGQQTSGQAVMPPRDQTAQITKVMQDQFGLKPKRQTYM
jgi:hypothetical protein